MKTKPIDIDSAVVTPLALSVILGGLLTIVDTAANLIDAPPDLYPDEWADANRVMPKGSPEPGPFRSSRNPYMIPIARAFADPRYRRVIFVMGTQMGKSATIQNVIGWKLDTDPAPVIYIGPTQSNIDGVVEPKFMDMFRECQSLLDKLAGDKGVSTKHKKVIAGVSLRFAWAGSATELASDSAWLTLVDELDRPRENATGEGDLTAIAEARGDAYSDSKLGLTSTPTVGKVLRTTHPVTGWTHWGVADKKRLKSPIWQEWQNGTRHEWAAPCPHCGQYFIPHSGLLTWDGHGSEGGVTPTQARKTARLICERSGCLIEDKYRNWMNARGVDVAPGQTVTSIRPAHESKAFDRGTVIGIADTHDNVNYSMWVTGLLSFSAKRSLGYAAEKLCAAELSGDPNKLQGVYNTVFGEVYWPAGNAPTWEQVYAIRAAYMVGTVFPDTHKILCTVDVQKNRLVYVVRGWMPGMSSYLIESGELWCEKHTDTSHPEVWTKLDDLLEKEFGEAGDPIDYIGVDCGYHTERVFEFVRRHKLKARALRGESLKKPYRVINIDVDKRGKNNRHGDKRWEFDSSTAKLWVHGRIHWPKDKPGCWLLPADITEDYCKQLVAEEFGDDGVWHQVGNDNHFLDCEAMSYMLARMVGIDRLKVKVSRARTKKAAADLAAPVPAETPAPIPVATADQGETEKPEKNRKRPRGARVARSGFMSRNR